MKEYIEREVAVSELMPIYKSASLRNRNVFSTARKCLESIEAIPAADVVEVDSVIPFVRVCDRKEYIKNSEKLINEYLAELLERFGVRCLAQSDNINGTVKFWAEKMDGGVNDAAD